MKIPPTRRAVGIITLGALASVGLVSVPTPTHAAVEEAHVGAQYEISGYSCEGDDQWSEDDDVPWTDNNVPTSHNTSASETFTGEEGDSVVASSSTSTTITASPIGSGPATITGSATATSSAVASGEETACDVVVRSTALTSGVFTIAKPMWATLTVVGNGQVRGNGAGTSLVGVGSVDGLGGPLGGLYGLGGDGLTVAAGDRGSAVSSTLLPAGQYGLVFGAAAYAATDGIEISPIGDSDEPDGSASYTGRFRIELEPLGAASAVTGKGASKVKFGARDCATGAVPVTLTKKTMKKAKRVKIKVRGTKVKVLKGKKLAGKKAKTFRLPAPASAKSKVKVKLVLKNGRRMHATRTYLPCE